MVGAFPRQTVAGGCCFGLKLTHALFFTVSFSINIVYESNLSTFSFILTVPCHPASCRTLDRVDGDHGDGYLMILDLVVGSSSMIPPQSSFSRHD